LPRHSCSGLGRARGVRDSGWAVAGVGTTGTRESAEDTAAREVVGFEMAAAKTQKAMNERIAAARGPLAIGPGISVYPVRENAGYIEAYLQVDAK